MADASPGSPPGSSPAADMGAGAGPVIIIGGAEDKFRDRVILHRFLELAGGSEGHIVIISTASSLGDQATDFYKDLFQQMGAVRVSGLRPLTREEANSEDAVDLLDDATGIYLTGGNQLKLSSVVGGTELGHALIEARDRGAVIAGTSAGASAISTQMMAFGTSGATPKHRMAHMSAGLGLLRNVLVDQHFEQRTRLGRLLAAVAQSPSLIGLGLDEDTAAIVYPDDTLEVIGRGAVTLVDGGSMVTDAFHTKGYKPMMVSGAILHSLPAGYRFDLIQRKLLAPDESAEDSRVRRRRERRPSARRLARDVAAEGANSFVIERRERGQTREASE